MSNDVWGMIVGPNYLFLTFGYNSRLHRRHSDFVEHMYFADFTNRLGLDISVKFILPNYGCR